MVAALKFSHVVLKTYDVARLQAWYCRALAAKVVFERPPSFSLLAYDEQHHRIVITGMSGDPTPGDPRAPGLVHLAFACADIRALINKYRTLAQSHIEPIMAVHHGTTISFYYSDPDGNGVEFLIDCFERAADAQAFLEHDFEAHAGGVDFNPAELLARMDAGESDQQLMHYEPSRRGDPDAVLARHRKLLNVG